MKFLRNKLRSKTRRYANRKKRTNEVIKAQYPESRIIINRSNKYISAQVINEKWLVLAKISDKGLTGSTKVERAKTAGIDLWKILIDKKLIKVVFDRNGYLYHWRVASFVDGLREAGLSI